MTDTIKLSDLTLDQHNANKGTERGRGLLEKSLHQYGAGRSILLDKNGRIIAGNKTAETAEAIGMDDVIVVKTDGTKLVAVQRTDLDIDEESGRMMAHVDNRVQEVDYEIDPLVLFEDFNAGLPLDDFWFDDELKEIFNQPPNVDFKEYGEDASDDVKYTTCPHCGERFPS